MGEVSRTARINYKLGLHARPATKIVEEASRFMSEIYLEKDTMRVNAKSVIELLTLAARNGEKLRITAEGEDAAAAVDTIAQLLESGLAKIFGE